MSADLTVWSWGIPTDGFYFLKYEARLPAENGERYGEGMWAIWEVKIWMVNSENEELCQPVSSAPVRSEVMN